MAPGDDQVCGAEMTLGLWTPVGCRDHATDRVRRRGFAWENVIGKGDG